MPIRLIRSRARHVAGRDIHIRYSTLATAPPEGAHQVLICPQCGGRTWRRSRWCVHCMLDLRLWRACSALHAAAGAVLKPLRRLWPRAAASSPAATRTVDRAPRLD